LWRNPEIIYRKLFLSWPSFWREISTCLSKMSFGKLSKQLDRFETEFHLKNHENRRRKAFLMSDSKGNYLQRVVERGQDMYKHVEISRQNEGQDKNNFRYIISGFLHNSKTNCI
jgi:hypothetical protein